MNAFIAWLLLIIVCAVLGCVLRPMVHELGLRPITWLRIWRRAISRERRRRHLFVVLPPAHTIEARNTEQIDQWREKAEAIRSTYHHRRVT